MDEAVCKFCEKPIWKDTDGWRHENSGSMPICNSIPEPKYTVTCPQCEGVPEMCNGYCEGAGTVTLTSAAEWHRQNDEAKIGKTLVDFAGSGPGKIFKRPKHGNAYTLRDHLVEIDAEGRTYRPRLTAEDLTATDWQEV